MFNPSMNEQWATETGLCIGLYGSRSLTARSYKGHTWLKIRPQEPTLKGSKQYPSLVRLARDKRSRLFGPFVVTKKKWKWPQILKKFSPENELKMNQHNIRSPTLRENSAGCPFLLVLCRNGEQHFNFLFLRVFLKSRWHCTLTRQQQQPLLPRPNVTKLFCNDICL